MPVGRSPGGDVVLRLLRRLRRDTSGQSMLETAIILPVILLLMLFIMEAALVFNAKQVANYAAFCAARTAAVYGYTDSDQAKKDTKQQRMRQSAAMAMAAVSPSIFTDLSDLTGIVGDVLTVFGVDAGELESSMEDIKNVVGSNAFTDYLARLADAYVRTSIDFDGNAVQVNAGTPIDENKKNVTVRVTYVYRCGILPLGKLWMANDLEPLINKLKGWFPQLAGLYDKVWTMKTRNITIYGDAKLDYWAD